MIIQNLLYTLPEISLLFLTTLFLLSDLWVGRRLPHFSYYASQASLWVTAFLLNRMIFLPEQIAFEGHFICDKLSIFLKLCILSIVFVVLLYSRSFLEQQKSHKTEYYALALFATIGMMLMVSSQSIVLLYLGLELLSLSLYAMVALFQSQRSTEAAMKYFILGAVASGLFLYGASLLFGVTGGVYLHTIEHSLSGVNASNPLVWIGMIFMMAGFLFKLGAVPFHAWIPDVYAGAPMPVTLFIASAPKIAAFALAYRLLASGWMDIAGLWWPLLGVVAIASLALGNWVALLQTELKRLLAYSTISHVGFILLGLMLGASQSFEASLYYVIVYALTTTAAFGVLLWLSQNGKEIHSIDELKGLHYQHPWMAFLFMLVCFSLAGVPPLAGFFAKFVILKGLVDSHLTWMALIAVVFSVVGAYYYLRLVKVMYFEQPLTPKTIEASDNKQPFPWVLTLNVGLIVFLGVYPTGLLRLCQILLG